MLLRMQIGTQFFYAPKFTCMHVHVYGDAPDTLIDEA